MDILLKVFLPLSLAFIMFTLGLGLTVADFKRVVFQPKAFAAGAVSQMVLLPIIAFGCAVFFGLPPELAVGFMILSFCPGGVTSNLIARLANGDVALSVTLTGVVSLASIITVPLMIVWSVAHFMGAEAPPVSVAKLGMTMFLLTAVPVAIGVVCRHFASGFSERFEPVFSKLATLLFVIIVIAALATGWSTFIANLPVLGPAVVVLNVVMLLVGYIVSKLCGLNMKELKTVAIESGVQNSTVGITLATVVTASATALPDMALPAAVYGITMYVVTLPFVYLVRSR